MEYEEILNIPPFSLNKKEKEILLTDRLAKLTRIHQKKCPEYARILSAVNYDTEKIDSYKEIPFLPVRLFKELDLKSVPNHLEQRAKLLVKFILMLQLLLISKKLWLRLCLNLQVVIVCQ